MWERVKNGQAWAQEMSKFIWERTRQEPEAGCSKRDKLAR